MAKTMTPSKNPPDRTVKMVSILCRKEKWQEVMMLLSRSKELALQPIPMARGQVASILHLAIKGQTNPELRASLILQILEETPMAAAIKNNRGYLPLHTIARRRNTNLYCEDREAIILKLMKCHKAAMTDAGGPDKRTPLHIFCTNFGGSPEFAKLIIENGREACFMKDSNGFLPAHTACRSHCGSEKLQMLLHANPQALFDETPGGNTCLSLSEPKTSRHTFATMEMVELMMSQYGPNSQSSPDKIVGRVTPVDSVASDPLSSTDTTTAVLSTVSIDEEDSPRVKAPPLVPFPMSYGAAATPRHCNAPLPVGWILPPPPFLPSNLMYPFGMLSYAHIHSLSAVAPWGWSRYPTNNPATGESSVGPSTNQSAAPPANTFNG